MSYTFQGKSKLENNWLLCEPYKLLSFMTHRKTGEKISKILPVKRSKEFDLEPT